MPKSDRRNSRIFGLLTCTVIAVLLPAQSPKKKITRAADVPVFQYKIDGKVEDLIQSEEAFRPLAIEIRRDVESVLRDYEVEDAATKRSLLATLLALDVLEKRDDDARAKLAEIKSLEESRPRRRSAGWLLVRFSGAQANPGRKPAAVSTDCIPGAKALARRSELRPGAERP